MSVLLYGSAVFLLGFAVHACWWRVSLPRRQTKALLLVFFAVLAAALAAFHAAPGLLPGAPRGWELARLALYVISLVLAYMITYSAIEADSPSLLITLAVTASGEGGLSPEEIYGLFDDHALLDPRLDDLLLDGMAVLRGGRYLITGKGRLFAAIFAAHRALLGAGRGG